MDNIYLIMLIALAILAIADLVVGVSNDAVNFLNSAIGSKAVSFKTIMIVASVGIAFGALSSSGMMEVARKGIFVPEKFYFDEIMVIFMAVMLTDILLLDFFNTVRFCRTIECGQPYPIHARVEHDVRLDGLRWRL